MRLTYEQWLVIDALDEGAMSMAVIAEVVQFLMDFFDRSANQTVAQSRLR